ncbi:hypothetical protein BEWA_037080 [Theileria equi strain WA]|uniref:Uncharacterized protein n=1 Tax=Theileria equi strain WA TaxID=1537102 RepID=L1LE08_THEEQ|nr:hypothetical protein BEWA_037080 [Theileria equi strain WA]EKX73672.1 hypothetical protein BEWA_037080 [Theileria equi strain WA]|eukprot:XP_004833124.1 hypothetical protein BEWA_037080 [Theileria equi strain WA]
MLQLVNEATKNGKLDEKNKSAFILQDAKCLENFMKIDTTKTENYSGIYTCHLNVEVKREPAPDGYFGYSHKPQKKFGVSGILHAMPLPINIAVEDVKTAVVYYWGKDVNLIMPVMVVLNVVAEKRLKRSILYTYSTVYVENLETRWSLVQKEVKLTDRELKARLDTLNCSLHKQVNINASMKDGYKSTFGSCSVDIEVTTDFYGSFEKVTHSAGGAFWLTSISQGVKPFSGLDIPDTPVSNVSFYFWGNDPILVEVTRGAEVSYFRHVEGTRWDDIDAADLRDTLETLARDRAPSFVLNMAERDSYEIAGAIVAVKTIKVEDYTQFKHTLQSRDSFKVSGLTHSGVSISLEELSKELREPCIQVSAYYWNDNMETPLLIEFETASGKFYLGLASGGASLEPTWRKEPRVSGRITNTLAEINCRVNRVYIFDALQTEDYDSSCVHVTVNQTRDPKDPLGYTRYMHSVATDSFTVGKIVGVSFPGITFPIPGVTRIYIFLPDSGDKPILLYVEKLDKIYSQWSGDNDEPVNGSHHEGYLFMEL